MGVGWPEGPKVDEGAWGLGHWEGPPSSGGSHSAMATGEDFRRYLGDRTTGFSAVVEGQEGESRMIPRYLGF